MSPGHAPFDERNVDELLLESGWGDDPGLKVALRDLRSLADGPPVAPSTRLDALMSRTPISLDARRKHRRTVVTALIVAASTGAGTAAVAATDSGFRETAQQTITTVVEAVTHGHSGRPAPEHGTPAGNPGSSVSPARLPELPAPAENAPGRSGNATSGPAATPPAHATKPSPAQQRGH
ncbi:hypothetical protein [Arthrobacter sp. C152]